MPKWLLIGIIIVLIIIIVLLTSIKNITTWTFSMLPGFYQADKDFCESADLKSMYLFIGQPTSQFSYDYPCYLVIHALHGVVVNQTTTINISEKWSKLSNYIPTVGSKYYNVTLSDMDEATIPSSLEMRFDPTTSAIRLIDGERLCGRLYKENNATELCHLN